MYVNHLYIYLCVILDRYIPYLYVTYVCVIVESGCYAGAPLLFLQCYWHPVFSLSTPYTLFYNMIYKFAFLYMRRQLVPLIDVNYLHAASSSAG